MEQKFNEKQVKELSAQVFESYQAVNHAWSLIYDLDAFPFVEYDYAGRHFCLNRTEMLSKLNTVSIYLSEVLSSLSDYEK